LTSKSLKSFSVSLHLKVFIIFLYMTSYVIRQAKVSNIFLYRSCQTEANRFSIGESGVSQASRRVAQKIEKDKNLKKKSI